MTIQLDFSTLNLQDALDMAVLIEKEAEERYLMFAEHLGQRYPGDAANFFTMMARNEQRHGIEISERRHLLFGDTPSSVTKNMIDDDIEAPDNEKSVRYMSPRQALEVSMQSEIKAYAFYDGILQIIQDATVRELIKGLRDEEAEHQSLLDEMRAKYLNTTEPDFDPENDELTFHRIRES
jgi:rubrerythrin